MGFLDGIGAGISQAATGGDGTMDLADYLKMAAMAGSIATGNVPGAIALGASYAGDATGSEMLKTAGDIGGMVAGGVGAVNALSAGAGAASSAAGAAGNIADQASTIGNMAEQAAAAESLASPIMNASTVSQIGATGADTLQPFAEAAAAGGGKFSTVLNNFLGETAQDKINNVGDLAGDLTELAAQPGHGATIAPQSLPWQGEDISQYLTSLPGDLSQFMMLQQGVPQSPYASQYSNMYGG